MMKHYPAVVVVAAAAVALMAVWGRVSSAPLEAAGVQNALILNYDSDNIGVDGYKFSFETSDGVSRKETATLKNAGTEYEAISVQGTVSWTSPDGEHYTLNYLADENGFQPDGEHLPIAPEA